MQTLQLIQNAHYRPQSIQNLSFQAFNKKFYMNILTVGFAVSKTSFIIKSNLIIMFNINSLFIS